MVCDPAGAMECAFLVFFYGYSDPHEKAAFVAYSVHVLLELVDCVAADADVEVLSPLCLSLEDCMSLVSVWELLAR